MFLQQAETVRLGQRVGDPVSVSVTDLDIEAADDVLIRCVTSGTHIGKAYSGKVEER